MKLIPYNPNDLDNFNIDIYQKDYAPLIKKLDKIYGKSDLKFAGFDKIIELGNPKGKIILDIGCGSINSQDDYFNTRTFEPWLARGLHELEATAIGIDLDNLEKEHFTGYNLDITNNNSLHFLPNNSIDIAIANFFFDSPALNRYKSGQKTFNLLLPQLNRIIKPNGYFIFDKLNTKY